MSTPRTAPVPRKPSEPVDPSLAEARERFVALWSQMGSNWGVPRSMAEVHALLYIVGRPMNTDEVMEQLHISRGSASTTLRSLVEWGLITRVHVRGDRKEYFQAEQDVWKLFRIILRERKKREVDPLLESLRACRELTTGKEPSRSRKIDPVAAEIEAHNARVDTMLEFVSLIDSMSRHLISPSGEGLDVAAKLLDRAS